MAGLLGLLCAGSAIAVRAQQEGGRSTRDGVYSAAQAERADKLFQERCIGCHEPIQLEHSWEQWAELTADQMFDNLMNTMPQDQPGSLTRDQYADLLALVFKFGGMPAGSGELKSDVEALKQIVIEAPDPPAGDAKTVGAITGPSLVPSHTPDVRRPDL